MVRAVTTGRPVRGEGGGEGGRGEQTRGEECLACSGYVRGCPPG